MKDLIQKIDQILNQFLNEEIGSKVTQFNMKGLRMAIIPQIANYKPVGEAEVKKDEATKKEK